MYSYACMCIYALVYIHIKHTNIVYAQDTVMAINGQTSVCPNPEDMAEGTLYQLTPPSLLILFLNQSSFCQVSRWSGRVTVCRKSLHLFLETRAVQELLEFKFSWKRLAWPLHTAWSLERQPFRGFALQTRKLWHSAKDTGLAIRKPESHSHPYHLETMWHGDRHLAAVGLSFLIWNETVGWVLAIVSCVPRLSGSSLFETVNVHGQ